MNRKLGLELHAAVKAAEADDAVGCLVITGAGERAFTAGGDIHEQLEHDAKFSDQQLDEIAGGPGTPGGSGGMASKISARGTGCDAECDNHMD